MPHWFWLSIDNCWFCKNRNGCSNCSVIKKSRKEIFGYKGKNKRHEDENCYYWTDSMFEK